MPPNVSSTTARPPLLTSERNEQTPPDPDWHGGPEGTVSSTAYWAALEEIGRHNADLRRRDEESKNPPKMTGQKQRRKRKQKRDQDGAMLFGE